MTAGVTSTIAAPFTPAAGNASRQDESSSGGFDEAVSKAGSRDSGQDAVGESKSSAHRWRQRGAGEASDNVSALKPGMSEDAEATTADDLAEDAAVASEEAGSDIADNDGEASNLSIQMKAEHAISAMMAMAPRDPSGDGAGQQKPGEEVAGQADALESKKASRPAGQSTALSTNGKADSSNAGTQAASVVTDTSADGTKVSGTGKEQNIQTGSDGEASQDTAKAVKPAGAESAGSQPATSDRSSATDQQKQFSGSANGGSGQSNAGTREQRDAAPEARRTEPQSATAKISVVSQQAAPAPAALVLGANAAAIVSAIDALQNLRPTAGSSAQLFHNTQPMRSLKIQLHPAELGMVTANLRAAGEQLSVELHVENHEAYHRLNADSDAIVKSLRALGYEIDRVSIQQPQAATTSVARSDTSAGTGSFSRDTSSFQPGSSGNGGERPGGQASGRGDRGDAQRNDHVQTNYQDRAGGSLYI